VTSKGSLAVAADRPGAEMRAVCGEAVDAALAAEQSAT
jgi:hypothetical protein